MKILKRAWNARHIRVKCASYFSHFSARHLQMTRVRQYVIQPGPEISLSVKNRTRTDVHRIAHSSSWMIAFLTPVSPGKTAPLWVMIGGGQEREDNVQVQVFIFHSVKWQVARQPKCSSTKSAFMYVPGYGTGLFPRNMSILGKVLLRVIPRHWPNWFGARWIQCVIKHAGHTDQQ